MIETPKKTTFLTIEGMSIINLIIKRYYIIDLPSRRFHDPCHKLVMFKLAVNRAGCKTIMNLTNQKLQQKEQMFRIVTLV